MRDDELIAGTEWAGMRRADLEQKCSKKRHELTRICHDGYAQTCDCGARLHYESLSKLREWQEKQRNA